MSFILTVAPNLLKRPVALERIHRFPIFGEEKKNAKISRVPNIGSGRIRPTWGNENATDWNMCHKIYSRV